MMRVRRSAERGHFDFGWLDTFHTFSFGDYVDPRHMNFRALRVMNEDRVAPGAGFPMHGHRDMEIVTIVLSGALEHRDSLGNGAVLRPGEVQRMTAGTGIRHSEFNPSASEPVHLYQIWLTPRQTGLTPGYEQRTIPGAGRENQWRLAASPDGEDGSLIIQQDARVYLAGLGAGREVRHEVHGGAAWLQVLRGRVTLGAHRLQPGDGVAIEDEAAATVQADEDAEVLLFDLA